MLTCMMSFKKQMDKLKKNPQKKHNHTSRKSVDKESLNKLGIAKAFIYIRG